jgi:hypothetical protein
MAETEVSAIRLMIGKVNASLLERRRGREIQSV